VLGPFHPKKGLGNAGEVWGAVAMGRGGDLGAGGRKALWGLGQLTDLWGQMNEEKKLRWEKGRAQKENRRDPKEGGLGEKKVDFGASQSFKKEHLDSGRAKICLGQERPIIIGVKKNEK